MALTQTLAQIRENVLQFADVKGTTALARHPVATVNDYINRGLGSLHRKLTEALPDQRYLSSSTITTVKGTSLYTLPADFEHLIDLRAKGVAPPYEQQRNIGLVMQFAATPDQQPDHMNYLQSNVATPVAPPGPGDTINGAQPAVKAPKRPFPMKTQPSSVYDRLSSGGPGRKAA